jgi:GDP-4-dehydro-6-deoxy-D-mannose reductase
MKTLVTGAAGFLGRALVQRLKQDTQHELHVTDLQPAPGGIFHRCDLSDPVRVAELLRTISPRRIYHLAGTFANEFGADFRSNVDSTRHLLEAVRQSGGPVRMLLIGSAAEYGCVREEDNPLREQQPLAPVSIYGWTKACQTLLMGYYHRVHASDVVMARLFNLTGSGASNRLFVGRLHEQVEQLLAGKIQEITVGPLDAVRDYLPVEEAARQVERVMLFGLSGQVYHIASGIPVRMRDLLGQLLQARGLSRDCVREVPQPTPNKLDPPAVYADVTTTSRLALPASVDSSSSS